MTAPTAPATFTREQAKASDAKLNELMLALSHAEGRVSSIFDNLRRAVGDDTTGYGARRTWNFAKADILPRAEGILAGTVAIVAYKRTDTERVLARYNEAVAALNAAEGAVEVQSREWAEHGQWLRYSVVPGGHIHTGGRSCHTLRITTDVRWAFPVSGDSVDEAIEVYGDVLCTHCFPNAPVANCGGKVATDAEGNPITKAEAEAIKDAKDAEKAAKLAQKNADAVIDPVTGAVLFKTERGATNAVASDLDSAIWYGPTHPSYNEWIALLDQVSEALGAKQGRPAAEVRAELVAKAEKKSKSPLGGKKCNW